MPLLRVADMTHYFGGLRAVHQFNLSVEPGEIRGLIGPNGAGKTTIFNLITGIHTPTKGTVELEGKNLRSGRQPNEIAASAGMGRTFPGDAALEAHERCWITSKWPGTHSLSYGLVGAMFDSTRNKDERQVEESHDDGA
jgi:branched-chain amino acid transport system ATP-binding protein